MTVQTEVIGYVSVFWSLCDRGPVQIDINGTSAVHTVIGKKKSDMGHILFVAHLCLQFECGL